MELCNDPPQPEVQPSLIEYPDRVPPQDHGAAGTRPRAIRRRDRHPACADFDPATVELRASKKKKYLSVTCVIRATSREQLDALYRELCDHPQVVMVL